MRETKRVVCLLFVILFFINADSPKSVKVNVATVYHAVVGQTDSSPEKTADGSIIDMSNPSKHRWIALSRDLIKNDFRNENYPKQGHWRGEFEFGDTVRVIADDKRLNGYWVVHDCMNARYSSRMDFLQGRDGFYGKWENITLIKKP